MICVIAPSIAAIFSTITCAPTFAVVADSFAQMLKVIEPLIVTAAATGWLIHESAPLTASATSRPFVGPATVAFAAELYSVPPRAVPIPAGDQPCAVPAAFARLVQSVPETVGVPRFAGRRRKHCVAI